MTDLRDIACFVEVAHAHGFKVASQRLEMAASTLSRRIVELEKSLGSKLFTRTTRNVQLTEVGRVYLRHCEGIVDAAKAAREDLENVIKKLSGLLRVSMSPDFGTAYLPSILAAFSALYPDIRMQLDLSPRRVDILSEGFDVAIRIGMPTEPFLVARKLMSAERGLYAAPRYIAAEGDPKTSTELSKLSCISVDYPNSGQIWTLRKSEKTSTVEVNGRVMANNPRMVLQLAVEGLGIAIIDRSLAKPFVENGQLVRVLDNWSIEPVPIYVVTSSRNLPLKTRLFTDFLHDQLNTSK